MGRSPKIMTAVLLMGVFLSVLDIGVTVPALTSIMQEWDVPYQWGIWTVTLYILILAVNARVFGHLSRRFGRQYILAVSLALFGAGAVLSGFAPHFSVLLAGRFLQGIGGGGALVSASFVLRRRGDSRFFGLMGLPLAAGAVLAFLVGSLLVIAPGWRWVFYVQILPSFIAFALIACRPAQAASAHKPFDIAGMLLYTCMILSLMLGFTRLNAEPFEASFLETGAFPFIVVALGLTVPFMMVERQHDHPLLPLEYFQQSHRVAVFLIYVFAGMTWAAAMFIPAFVENVLRLDSGVGGYMLSLLAAAAVIALAASIWAEERFEAPLIIAAGFLLCAGAYFMMGAPFVHRFWSVALSVFICGLGTGALIGGLRQAVPARSPAHYPISSFFYVSGMCVGSAVLATFLAQAARKIPSRVRDSLVATSPRAEEVSGGIFADLVRGTSQFIIPDPERLQVLIPDHLAASTQELIMRQIVRVIRRTLTEGYEHLFLLAAVFALAGLVCVLGLRLLGRARS